MYLRSHLRTSFRAVHNCVTSVDGEGIPQFVQSIFGALVARINHPPVSLHQNGGAQVPVGVPPVAGTRCGAAGAENALVKTILKVIIMKILLNSYKSTTNKFCTIFGGLQELLLSRSKLVLVGSLEPGLDRFVLLVKVVHVRHKILDDIHVRKGVDFGNLSGCVNFAAKQRGCITSSKEVA